MAAQDNLNPAQFFHGTRAQLKPGDMVVPGHKSNYEASTSDKHVYLTESHENAAGWALDAHGAGKPRIYTVSPTGPIEPDEDAIGETEDASSDWYARRSTHPLRVTGEAAWPGR